MTDPVSITYREFYDVPRLFVVERDGTAYLFECPFDPDADDYSDRYTVYALPGGTFQDLSGSWASLRQRGRRLPADVPVAAVVFDPTRRAYVDGSAVDMARPSKVATGRPAPAA